MADVRIPSALTVDQLAARLVARLAAPGAGWAGVVAKDAFAIRPTGWNFGAVRGRFLPTDGGSEIAIGPPRPPVGSLIVVAVLGYILLPQTQWRAHVPSLIALGVVVVAMLVLQDRQYRAQWEHARRFLEELAR